MSGQPKTGRFRRLAAAARRLAGSGDGLHRCSDCGRPFVCPIHWEPVGDEHRLIALHCGECGAWREQPATNEPAERYDLELDRQYATISAALRSIDRRRMQGGARPVGGGARPRPHRRGRLRPLTEPGRHAAVAVARGAIGMLRVNATE